MTKKERRLAMATALQKSAENMTVVDAFESIKGSKTKTCIKALLALNIDPMKEKVVLISKAPDSRLRQTCRNIHMLTLLTTSSLNIFDIINAHKIVMEKDVLVHIN